MDQVLQALAVASPPPQPSAAMATTASVVFGRVEAEQATQLCEQYGVTVVPTFVLLNEQGNVVQRIEGTDDTIAQVTQAVKQLLATTAATTMMTPATTPAMTMSTTNHVVATEQQQPPALSQRLETLIHSSEVMIFMKGTPTAPKCGFSRQVVELLQEEDICFGSFNILADDDVRQGLKTHSNWPTYPQVYVRGELMGGLDILKEMKEQGPSLVEQLGLQHLVTTNTTTASPQLVASSTLHERLSQLVKRHHIMLFMKGLPSAPKCGFSRQMVELLNKHGVAFDAFDILQDDQVRQGLKTFSNWPTFPQLYVNGELVGGMDICQELQESGEFAQLVK